MPSGVTVEVTERHVKVSGPKGTLERDTPRDITIVSTARTNAEGRALLDAFGFPFRRADAQQ